MQNTVNHAQIDAFITYKKTRSINEYTARLSIFKNINSGIKNDCINEVAYIKGNDLSMLQVEVLKHWDNVSTSFKKQFNLSFCNDRMTRYKYRSNKMIGNITSYNLIAKK
jgi:hypothetical protein